MVRVSGQESAAVVTAVSADVSNGLGELSVRLTMPLREFGLWMIGTVVRVEASWNLPQQPAPAHADLADILEKRSAQGNFMVRHVQPTGDRLFIELGSTDIVKPLQS